MNGQLRTDVMRPVRAPRAANRGDRRSARLQPAPAASFAVAFIGAHRPVIGSASSPSRGGPGGTPIVERIRPNAKMHGVLQSITTDSDKRLISSWLITAGLQGPIEGMNVMRMRPDLYLFASLLPVA